MAYRLIIMCAPPLREIKQRANYGIIKLLFFNLASINALIAVLMTLAYVLNIVVICTICYCILNVAVAIVAYLSF